MCKLLSVSKSGFYKRQNNTEHPLHWKAVLAEILKIRDEHEDNDNYGVERMKTALERKGIVASRNTIRKAMRTGNLLHKNHRSPDGLTKADKKAKRPENIIKRDFSAKKPFEKWLTDITEIRCKNGKLYVCPVFDCFSGEIVGLAMDTNMKKELCINAVADAYNRFSPKGMVTIHSDAGSQFTSEAYCTFLGSKGAIQSMSDVGKCYDNARMESFFATLKKEKIYKIKTEKMVIEQVKTVVFRYIMNYYNRVRITTVNENGIAPSICREQYFYETLAA